jgi:hypothetical protein
MTATLVLGMPVLEQTTTGSRLTARLDAPSFSQLLYYQVQGCSLTLDSTPFLAAALPLAMSRGWKLQVHGPVSGKLLQALPQLQAIYRNWVPGLQTVTCDVPQVTSSARLHAAGMFFSAGVDSYYTLLKHEQSVSSLVFVTGFDIPLHKQELAERVQQTLRHTAGALTKKLIVVETNLRTFCDDFVNWRMYHGAALASVAHLTGQAVGRMYLGATHTYADLFPCGSHPLLDPLWSSDAVEIVHDGCEATRFQKVARLAQSPVALQTLRVCYRNKGTELNCGRCEKCLRTMTSLYALGVLEQCTTFSKQLDLRRIASLRLGDNPRIRMYVEENLTALKERHDGEHVSAAVRRSLRRPGLLQQLNRQAKPLLRRSTYLQWLGAGGGKTS